MSRPQGRPAPGRTPGLRSGLVAPTLLAAGHEPQGLETLHASRTLGPPRVHPVLGGSWGPPSRGPRRWGTWVRAEAPAWMSGGSLLRTQGGLFSGGAGRELRAGLGLEAEGRAG